MNKLIEFLVKLGIAFYIGLVLIIWIPALGALIYNLI